MPFIYSTCSLNIKFNIFHENTDKGTPDRVAHSVTINGKANVANKHFETPRGVVTTVSQDDLDVLLKMPYFMKKVKMGHFSLEKVSEDPEKVAKDMTPKDAMAPLTPESLSKTTPVTEVGTKTQKGKRASK